MATSKGGRHGYTGVAAVDSAHQIIVEAHAQGTGARQELLVPIVPATHKTPKLATPACCTPCDFVYDPVARTCVCPAGRSLYRRGQARVTKGYVAFLRVRPTSDRDARRPYDSTTRYTRRSRTVRAALRHCKAGLRESSAQQAPGSLHAAWTRESRRTMGASLHGAQHREARQRRIRGVVTAHHALYARVSTTNASRPAGTTEAPVDQATTNESALQNRLILQPQRSNSAAAGATEPTNHAKPTGPRRRLQRLVRRLPLGPSGLRARPLDP